MFHKKKFTGTCLKMDKLVTDRKFIKLDSFAADSTEFDFVFKRLRSHQAHKASLTKI